MPKVSICIPSYKPEYFELALNSALSQTFTDTEIIVSDDCPTDDIEKMCAKYPAVQYSRNSNPSQAFNIIRSLQLARSEYVKFVFDDDLLMPECVQHLYAAMEATRAHNTVLAFSPRFIIDANNNVLNFVNHFNLNEQVAVIPGADYIRLTAIHHRNLVGEFSTVLLRKADCFDAQGNFSLCELHGDIFRGNIDIGCWLTLAKRGAFVGYPKPLSFFRTHENTTSNPKTNENFIQLITHYEQIMDDAASSGLLRPDELATARRNLIRDYEGRRADFPELNERISKLQAALQ